MNFLQDVSETPLLTHTDNNYDYTTELLLRVKYWVGFYYLGLFGNCYNFVRGVASFQSLTVNPFFLNMNMILNEQENP